MAIVVVMLNDFFDRLNIDLYPTHRYDASTPIESYCIKN